MHGFSNTEFTYEVAVLSVMSGSKWYYFANWQWGEEQGGVPAGATTGRNMLGKESSPQW